MPTNNPGHRPYRNLTPLELMQKQREEAREQAKRNEEARLAREEDARDRRNEITKAYHAELEKVRHRELKEEAWAARQRGLLRPNVDAAVSPFGMSEGTMPSDHAVRREARTTPDQRFLHQPPWDSTSPMPLPWKAIPGIIGPPTIPSSPEPPPELPPGEFIGPEPINPKDFFPIVPEPPKYPLHEMLGSMAAKTFGARRSDAEGAMQSKRDSESELRELLKMLFAEYYRGGRDRSS